MTAGTDLTPPAPEHVGHLLFVPCLRPKVPAPDRTCLHVGPDYEVPCVEHPLGTSPAAAMRRHLGVSSLTRGTPTNHVFRHPDVTEVIERVHWNSDASVEVWVAWKEDDDEYIVDWRDWKGRHSTDRYAGWNRTVHVAEHCDCTDGDPDY